MPRTRVTSCETGAIGVRGCDPIELRQVRSLPDQSYYLCRPTGEDRPRAVLVSVHGISRNADEHVTAFGLPAARHGLAVVAPLFDAGRYPDYQRLGRGSAGLTPDSVLERIIADLPFRARHPRLLLFGFSGGAQFAHRFALRHPRRVAALAVGAAGWYSFPDPAVRYPRGAGWSARYGTAPIDLAAALSVPALVLVGERDTHDGSALRLGERIEDQQGRSRLERGRNWADAMRSAARACGLATEYRFESLPRCGHDFNRCVRCGGMVERVVTWLAPHVEAWSERADPIGVAEQ